MQGLMSADGSCCRSSVSNHRLRLLSLWKRPDEDQGAYRFFDHERAMFGRMKAQQLVPCVQDTTSLDYRGIPDGITGHCRKPQGRGPAVIVKELVARPVSRGRFRKRIPSGL